MTKSIMLQVEEVYGRQTDRQNWSHAKRKTYGRWYDLRKCEKTDKQSEAMTMQINDAVHRIAVEMFASAIEKRERARERAQIK